MLALPHDLGLDPNEDQDILYFKDHQEAGAERHAPAGAPVLHFSKRD